MVGQASEVIPTWAQWSGALMVLLLSIKPLYGKIAPLIKFNRPSNLKELTPQKSESETFPAAPNCGPT
jgi:hypothetical protein